MFKLMQLQYLVVLFILSHDLKRFFDNIAILLLVYYYRLGTKDHKSP